MRIIRGLATVVLLGWILPAAFIQEAGAVPAATSETASAAGRKSAGSSSEARQRVAVVRLEGQIDDFNRDNFIKRFNQARATGAKILIVDLDTYGGLVTAGLDISRFIKSQDDVYTACFIGSKAISAGAMIAVACNEIVMAPSSQLGDCAPIALKESGQMETMGAAERAKAESPILSEFRDSALRNGYDPLLVQSMVSLKLAVHWVQSPDGKQRRFVDQKEFDKLIAAKPAWTEVQEKDVPTPVDLEDTLLTINSKAALKLGLAAAEQSSIASLATVRNWDIVAVFNPGAGDRVIEWLNHPLIRMLLMVIFAQCLYAALHAPGHGFAEVLAVVALAILVAVPMMTGYAQWWEILAILIGIVLVALEIFVIPGFGLAGILGILLLLYGLVMTFVGKEPSAPAGPHMPTLEGTWTGLRTGLAAVVGALVCSIFVSMWLRRYLPKLPYFRRLILTTVAGDIPHPATEGVAAGMSGEFWPAVGAFGEAVSDLRPGGSASFYDPAIADVRVLSVISAKGYVGRGAKLVVLDNRDNRLMVREESENVKRET